LSSQDLNVIYAQEPFPDDIYFQPSLFLLGPTPRTSARTTKQDAKQAQSWRPRAIAELRRQGYNGYVLVPEPRPDANGVSRFRGDYLNQIEWETAALRLAWVIMAYIPRSMAGDMPGLTSNEEWGTWKDSGKIVLGSPEDADHNRYLKHFAHKLGVPVADTLPNTVMAALGLLSNLFEPSCPFCQIGTTDNYQQVVWRGRDTVAFTPHYPVTPGHTLIIPRIHVHGALSRPHISGRTMHDATEYVRQLPHGNWNIITSAGGNATQTVFHLHCHIVPRRANDGLPLPCPNQIRP